MLCQVPHDRGQPCPGGSSRRVGQPSVEPGDKHHDRDHQQAGKSHLELEIKQFLVGHDACVHSGENVDEELEIVPRALRVRGHTGHQLIYIV